MRRPTATDKNASRYRFTVLYIGDCDDRYRRVATALEASQRLRFEVCRLAAADATSSSLRSHQDEAWLIDAVDDVGFARRLIAETGDPLLGLARVILLRGDGSAPLQDEVTIDADDLHTETIERSLAESLRRCREQRVCLERQAHVQLQPPPADGRFTINAEGTIESADESAERLLGFPPGGMCGLAARELAPAIDAYPDDAYLSADSERMGARLGRDMWLKQRDGTAIPVNVLLSRQTTANGRPATVATLSDLREAKESERHLRQSKRFLQAALNSLSARIAILDHRGVIIAVNDAWQMFADEQADLRPSALVGANYLDACAAGAADCGPEGEKVAEGVRQLLAGRCAEIHLQYTFTGPQHSRWFVVSATRFADDGRYCVVVAHEEVTERNRLQTQLLQAQKLESIGQLAAGIAHEINTPTQYIGDNTRFLQDAFRGLEGLLVEVKRLSTDPAGLCTDPAGLGGQLAALAAHADLDYLLDEIPKAISQSLEGIDRVAGIVGAMKEFAHPGTPDKTPVDLNRAIQSTLTVARNEWKYIADVVTELDESLPPVPCLPGEINQVVLNLVVNAAHAIGDVVSAGKRSKGEIRVATRLDGDFVEIRVADNGTGIPPEVQGKIFDPFFSTKGVGKGTGQGLAISHAVVVEKHGGTITFETEAGHGTTFVVRLPLHTTDEAERASADTELILC
ncbi:MAG TPA: ATP-binding protein [Pirellulales bacterium]|jgi:PAS domain S-box-containing protein|nr:ATP-binding protein [Pirellulales bacterium]